ncbi:site-2 protease family protein [Streptomyces sp. JB150]|uniref:site-2 protease family protein n=1 Tax=Streptomyces sp. JB150 TaxID=2714844 RepID=UPI0014077354|nr:site-2 protease family protein [Streptomyces sp. JB150]QIJ61751.1 peptidase [Streptomyces sp. JB150]
MDESGGSGQPRSGNDDSTGPHATPAPHPTPDAPVREDRAASRTTGSRAEPAPHGDDTASPAAATGAAGKPGLDKTPGPSQPAPERPMTDRPTPEGPAPDQPASERPTPERLAPERPTPSPSAPEHPAPQRPAAERPTLGQPSPRQTSAAQPSAAHTSPGQPPAEQGRPPAPPRGAAPAGQRPGADAGAGDAARPGGHERPHAHSGPKGPAPRRPEPGGGLLMGRPFGVPVYVTPSWFLVAALITWVFGGQLDHMLPELGGARYLVALFFAVAFYASVLVHELAHTVAALRFKLPVRRIQLQFFGGVSEIEKEAETPGREFVLAFVGPLLSLVLAGVFYLAMQPVEPGTVPSVLLAGLMISNLIVAVFNLLPGLPLDGGRMLRAVVWKLTGKPMSGTIAAAWVGRALAVSVLIGLPLLTQSGLLGADAEDNVGMDTVLDALLAAILAAIIWTGAGNSLRVARLREHLPELRARALTRRAVPVPGDTPLSEALRRANAAGARALVVVDADGSPLSIVREAAIVGVPEHRRPWVSVSGLAQELTDGMRVLAELAGEELLDALRAHPATEYLVVEETGEIYGVLSAADVERAFVKAMARPS